MDLSNLFYTINTYTYEYPIIAGIFFFLFGIFCMHIGAKFRSIFFNVIAFLAIVCSVLHFLDDPSKTYSPIAKIIKIEDNYKARANLKNELNLNPQKYQNQNPDELMAFNNKLISYGLYLEIDDDNHKQIKQMTPMQWFSAVKNLEEKILRGEKIAYLADPEKEIALREQQAQAQNNLQTILNKE